MKLQGYTLVELMIVCAIIAILTISTEAHFQQGFFTIKARGVAMQIINEMNLARSLAIKKQQDVCYCTNSTWSEGRLIKTVNNEILHLFTKLPKDIKVNLRNSLNCNSQITFTPLGFTKEQRGSFYVSSPSEKIRIIIGVSGYTRMESDLSDFN